MPRNAQQIKVGFPEQLDSLIKDDASNRSARPPQIVREIVTEYYIKQGRYDPNRNGK